MSVKNVAKSEADIPNSTKLDSGVVVSPSGSHIADIVRIVRAIKVSKSFISAPFVEQVII